MTKSSATAERPRDALCYYAYRQTRTTRCLTVKVPEESTLMEIPELPSKAACDKWSVTSTPKMNSIRSVDLIQYRRVTDTGPTVGQTDTGKRSYS